MKPIAPRTALAAVLLAGCVACASLALAGAEGSPIERRIKAAYLYKFTGYVQWPAGAMPGAETPLVIGVAGSDDMIAELQQIVRGRTADAHPLLVRLVHDGEPLAGVHILFVGHGHEGLLQRIAREAPRPATLVVTEGDGCLTRGAMINFIVVDNHVRFEIARGNTEAAGLTLRSQLLSLAVPARRTP